MNPACPHRHSTCPPPPRCTAHPANRPPVKVTAGPGMVAGVVPHNDQPQGPITHLLQSKAPSLGRLPDGRLRQRWRRRCRHCRWQRAVGTLAPLGSGMHSIARCCLGLGGCRPSGWNSERLAAPKGLRRAAGSSTKRSQSSTAIDRRSLRARQLRRQCARSPAHLKHGCRLPSRCCQTSGLPYCTDGRDSMSRRYGLRLRRHLGHAVTLAGGDLCRFTSLHALHRSRTVIHRPAAPQNSAPPPPGSSNGGGRRRARGLRVQRRGPHRRLCDAERSGGPPQLVEQRGGRLLQRRRGRRGRQRRRQCARRQRAQPLQPGLQHEAPPQLCTLSLNLK